MMQNVETVADPDLVGVSPLLTYSEAGRYLRKSATYVRQLVHAGELTITRLGRSPLIEQAELDRYIARHRETGEAAKRPGMTPPHRRGNKVAGRSVGGKASRSGQNPFGASA